MNLAAITLLVTASVVTPKEVVQKGTEHLRVELRRTSAKPAEIMKAVEQFVDLGELAKRSLADAWGERSEKERTEFVDTMKDVLRASYEDTARQQLKGEITFVKEDVDGDEATVTATVKAKTDEVPLVYKLYKRDGGWKVYDLVVDESSLLEQYRSSFKRTIATKGFAGLLSQLKAKKAEIEKRGKLASQ
jgi:phospholipid transport system substrate-binding protein